jgi:DNA-binding transcriptional ArsR family regulator
MKDAVKIFKALSNDTRLKIIQLLSRQPLCVNALACSLSVSQPAVSQHLKVLENAGLVKGDKRGYWVHYELVHENLRECASFMQDLIEEVKENVQTGA